MLIRKPKVHAKSHNEISYHPKDPGLNKFEQWFTETKTDIFLFPCEVTQKNSFPQQKSSCRDSRLMTKSDQFSVCQWTWAIRFANDMKPSHSSVGQIFNWHNLPWEKLILICQYWDEQVALERPPCLVWFLTHQALQPCAFRWLVRTSGAVPRFQSGVGRNQTLRGDVYSNFQSKVPKYQRTTNDNK